jgi:hypothetical protein
MSPLTLLHSKKEGVMSEYALIIRNGTIVDGSRLPAYRADLDEGLKTEFGLIDFVNGDKYAVGEIL